MRNLRKDIAQFDLSPSAKAGVLLINMQNQKEENEHDVSAPHRDKHYLLLMATHGRFKLNLDFEELNVEAPAMLLVFPGQVHHILEINGPQGWAISFDPSLIDNEFHALLERMPKGPFPLNERTDFYARLVSLMKLLEKIQADVEGIFKAKTIHALLTALLSLIAGKLTHSVSGGKIKESRSVLIEESFHELLKRNYKTWKQPSRYAAELAISVSHLNDTVKSVTGSSVSEHIQQYAILEARRLLYFTDLSVKEIGYELGYDEPVYFGKLFKKVTGFTPLQFRLKFRG